MQVEMKRLNRLLSMLLEDYRYMEDGELPMRWQIMHLYSSSQVAKILAMKRGLDLELAAIIAACHDMGSAYSKKRADHAQTGLPYIKALIKTYNEEKGKTLKAISPEEEAIILQAVSCHSQKDQETDLPYVELMKDVDSLDRYLHGIDSQDWHENRLKKVLVELKLREEDLS